MLFPRHRIFRLILMENLFGIHSTRSTCSLFLWLVALHNVSCDRNFKSIEYVVVYIVWKLTKENRVVSL